MPKQIHACYGKVIYATKAAARQKAGTGKGYKPYRCPFCEKYHVAHYRGHGRV